MLESDQHWPLWGEGSLEGAFELETPGGKIDNAVVTSVERPFLSLDIARRKQTDEEF